jgi:hypothetical protein
LESQKGDRGKRNAEDEEGWKLNSVETVHVERLTATSASAYATSG